MNQSRANVRARDEDAPKALAGMRPKASISANAGPEFATVKIPSGRNDYGSRAYYSDEFLGKPRGAALNVSQTLYDGGRTASSVRQRNPWCYRRAPPYGRPSSRSCRTRRPPI